MFSIWEYRYSYGICFGTVYALQNSTPNISTPNILSLFFSVHTRRVEIGHILCRRSWLYIYIRKNCHVNSWVKIVVLRWCLSSQALSNTSFLVPRCWGLPPVAAWTCQDPPAGWWSQAHPPFMLDIGPECVNPLVNRGKGLLEVREREEEKKRRERICRCEED